MVRHFIRVNTVCMVKKSTKEYFFTYNLTSLDNYVQWTIPKFFISNQMEESISKHRVNPGINFLFTIF